MIYADHNATTPPLPAVVDAVAAVLADGWGNPGSRQHPAGRRALATLDAARASVAALVAARPEEVVFTSGASESCNLAILGLGERLLAARPRLVASAGEHPAVLEPLRRLAEAGAELVLVPPERDGAMDAGRLAQAIDDRTGLVAIMLANHETGVVNDVAAVAALAHARGALVVCDATQAVGRLAVDVAALGADAVAWTAHKLYGPPGTGALWLRRGLGCSPQIHGGGQERGLRGGMPNLSGIAGFAVASAAAQAGLAARCRHLAALGARLEDGVRAAIPGIVVHGGGLARLPGTTMLSVPGLPAGWLATLVTVAASGGAACSGGRGSDVLRAMGWPAAEAGNSIRISLGIGSTVAEVDVIVAELAHGAATLRGRVDAGRALPP